MKHILITQRVTVIPEIGEHRDALSWEWSELAAACGILLIPVPNRLETVEQMLAELRADGILLTGGNDLSAYGGDAPERDAVERRLIAYAQENKVPLLAVCRGMQMLLDYFGVPLQRVEGHVRTFHCLSNEKDVNSFHQWAAVDCPAPVRVIARSEDGIVEEITHDLYPNLHGIMWHPERYHPPRMQDIQWIKEVFQV